MIAIPFKEKLEKISQRKYENLSSLIEDVKGILNISYLDENIVICLPYHTRPWTKSWECAGKLLDGRHLHVEYEIVDGGYYQYRNIYFVSR